MSKQRRSVSLEESVDEYLSKEGVNASQLVNNLVRKYIEAGGELANVRTFRIQQLESELQSLETQQELKREQLEQVRANQQQENEVDESKRKELLRKVQRVPAEPDHPYVQEVADELNMTPEEVLTERENL